MGEIAANRPDFPPLRVLNSTRFRFSADKFGLIVCFLVTQRPRLLMLSVGELQALGQEVLEVLQAHEHALSS